MSTQIDHLVVTADSLEAGRQWCEATLGVSPSAGGRHALMGTHNLLVNLSSALFPACYLEIIAIDREAPPPGRPRWFGLDERAPGPPRLVQAVVRSRMLDMHRFGLIHKGADPGLPVKLSRGALSWQMLLRADGQAPPGLPMLIQWDGPHPTDALPDTGLRLQSVSHGAMPAAQAAVLKIQHLQTDATPPGWRAVIDTPRGPVTLA
jgi:Glyoxalase-like domain